MHYPWIGRRVGDSRLFGDRQGIDIRPQANGIVAVAPMNHREHACSIEVVQRVHAEGPESLLNERAGAGFSEAELRMCMQVPAPSDHFFVIALYFFENRHRGHLLLTEFDRGWAAAKNVSRAGRGAFFTRSFVHIKSNSVQSRAS